MSRIKLICIPFAGGSASAYYKWSQHLQDDIELVPLELAGHMMRLEEELYQNMDEAADDLVSMIEKKVENTDYVLYGHSMGGLLAFEVVRKLALTGKKLPEHLIISGSNPPHVKRKHRQIAKAPLEVLKEEILKLGGTPLEIFDNPEYSEIFVPMIRADYRLLEEYEYIPSSVALQCPLSIFWSDEDGRIDVEQISSWKDYGKCGYHEYKFKGNHFFIFDSVDEVTSMVNYIIQDL